MSAEETCTRWPCDTAARRGTHTPNRNGEIWHETHWGSEHGGSGNDELRWKVAAGAWDDGPWMLAVTVPGRTHGFGSLGAGWEGREAFRFHEDVSKALSCITTANQQDTERQKATLRQLAWDAEDRIAELEEQLAGLAGRHADAGVRS